MDRDTVRRVAGRTGWVLLGTAPRAVARFVLVNAGIHLVTFAAAAPSMIRVVRADGGTGTEHLIFVFFVATLAAGMAWAMLALYAAFATAGKPGLGRAGVIAAEALVAFVMIGDIVTFTQMGLHPYGAATWAGIGITDLQNLPWWFVVGVAISIVALLAVEWGLLTVVRRFTVEGHAPHAAVGKRCLAYAVAGSATFLFVDQDDAERVVPRAALPLYNAWIAPAGNLPELRPRAPANRVAPMPTMTDRPDIAVLVAESLRWDMLTNEVMPHVTRFAQEHDCFVAPRHYAGGHLTQYGVFSLLYGLGGWAFLPYMQELRLSWPLDVLRANGYESYGFDATGVMGYTIPPLSLDQFDRYETMLSNDMTVLRQTREHLQNRSRPPRLTVSLLYGTHAPYLYPSGFERFASPPGPQTMRGQAWTRYRNSVAYLDQLLHPLLQSLDDPVRTGKTVLIFTGDHGEEFWEFGLTGHAAILFHDVRTRVPLVLCAPGARTLNAPLSEHADVFPTLLESWGVPVPPDAPVSGYALPRRPATMPVAIAGAGFPIRDGRFALVTPEAKFWVEVRDPAFADIAVRKVTDLNDVELTAVAGRETLVTAPLEAFHRVRRTVLRVN